MTDQDIQIDIPTADGHTLSVRGVRIYAPTTCAHCHHHIMAYAWALNAPYHCMLHPDCLPHFNFTHGWPHPMPAVAYLGQSASPRHHHPPPPLLIAPIPVRVHDALSTQYANIPQPPPPQP